MTPFPHLKQTSQEPGGTPGVKKFQRKLQMNFKEDFFLGHPVVQTFIFLLRNTTQFFFTIKQSLKVKPETFKSWKVKESKNRKEPGVDQS